MLTFRFFSRDFVEIFPQILWRREKFAQVVYRDNLKYLHLLPLVVYVCSICFICISIWSIFFCSQVSPNFSEILCFVNLLLLLCIFVLFFLLYFYLLDCLSVFRFTNFQRNFLLLPSFASYFVCLFLFYLYFYLLHYFSFVFMITNFLSDLMFSGKCLLQVCKCIRT